MQAEPRGEHVRAGRDRALDVELEQAVVVVRRGGPAVARLEEVVAAERGVGEAGLVAEQAVRVGADPDRSGRS